MLLYLYSMVNIFGAGSNQIVIYCDAINDFTYGFFPITITNVFTREQKTFNPEVIVKNTRYIKLCFNLVATQPQEDLSVGKIYIKTQGTFEFQVGNSATFNTNVSLMNPYRIVETIEAQVELREQEVKYTSFISENEDLEAYVFVDDDPCPDGNCPPTDCFIPSEGDTYGGGLVYEVDTENRIAYIAGQTDIDGLYDWGGFGKQVSGLIEMGKEDTEQNLLQLGKKGQAADIITGRLINGYSDWYLPSDIQFSTARQALGASLSVSNQIYWTSWHLPQNIGLAGGFVNEIYNSNLFTKDYINWQDVTRDASFFSVMGVFTGDIDASNTIDVYPAEIIDISGKLTNEMYWSNGNDGDSAVQQIGSASFFLENNTFYTYRAYFKATGTLGEIEINFTAQNFALPLGPSVTLSFFNEVQLGSFQSCEVILTNVGDDWFRLEMSMATLSGTTTNVSVSQVVRSSGSNLDFYWWYSSPTFRKGYFNRHAPFVAPNTTPQRVNRTFYNGDENPIEGTYSVGIGGYDYGTNDVDFQDINLSYLTPYTCSNSLTLHAKNYGCRYVKVSSNNNPPYDMENPWAIVDLETGNIVKQTTSSMNWILNNFNVNDTRWVKSRTIFSKEYKKDIWGEYTSWLIGTTQSDALSPRFYYDLTQRTSLEDLSFSFYIQPKDNQEVACLLMNTGESVIGQIRYNPQTNAFSLIDTANYVISATAIPGAMGDWDRVMVHVRIPSGQTTLRTNIVPYPGGSTNIHTWSNIPANNYSPAQMTKSTQTVVMPDGTLAQPRYLETTANDTHLIQSQVGAGFPVTSGLQYRLSFFVRPVGTRNIEILFVQNASGSVRFNLSTGSVVSGSGTITASVNGFWRVSTAFTATGTGNVRFLVYSVNGAATTFVGSTSSGFDVGQFQIERGNILTDFIYTEGSQATAQRNINICGVQVEGGTVSTDPIFTNGNTIFYRNDLLTKWATPNGAPTFTNSPAGFSPEETTAVRINFGATYSVIETPNLTGLILSGDYVFSTYVKEGTSGFNTPNFSIEIDGAPAGSTQQGSSFTWAFNGSYYEPRTTSLFAGIRDVGSGWFQIWHRIKLAASGTITNIQAEFRATPTTPGNFFVWNPLVEAGLTPSVLPRVYRRPHYSVTTLLSKDWVRIDQGTSPFLSFYNRLDNRFTFTPLKSISGASASTTDGIQVWGAQATNQSDWLSIYPIENYTQRTFIPQCLQEGTPDGEYSAYGYNPFVNRTGFYRKDLYFKIRPFRQQPY